MYCITVYTIKGKIIAPETYVADCTKLILYLTVIETIRDQMFTIVIKFFKTIF